MQIYAIIQSNLFRVMYQILREPFAKFNTCISRANKVGNDGYLTFPAINKGGNSKCTTTKNIIKALILKDRVRYIYEPCSKPIFCYLC